MRGRKPAFVLGLLLSVVPGAAGAWNMPVAANDALPERICLLNVNAVPSYCRADRIVHPIGGWPVIIDLGAPTRTHIDPGGQANDIVVIRGTPTGGCNCTCGGGGAQTGLSYNAGSTVAVIGGPGGDAIIAPTAQGNNSFYGDVGIDTSPPTYDILVGGQFEDHLYGGVDNDRLIDTGGGFDILSGEANDDRICDPVAAFCDGGGGADLTRYSGFCTNTEGAASATDCQYSCPAEVGPVFEFP